MTEAALVTGGSGFIGTWVLRELQSRGIRPIVFDRCPAPVRWRRILGPSAPVEFVEGDLLDTSRLSKACEDHRVTRLIHLAALLTPDSHRDPMEGCRVNVLGSMGLFEVTRASYGRIAGLAYASSLAAFGPPMSSDRADGPTAENRPGTFYGAFKRAVELIAEQYWIHCGVASVGIRPHVVYGPERDQGLSADPSLAARAAAEGRPFTLSYTGIAGYDYVEDVARALVQSALYPPRCACVVDLPGPRATTEEIVREIVAIVPGARLTIDGPPLPESVPPRPEPIDRIFPDWQVTSLRDGLRKTIAFYQNPRVASPEI